MANIKDIRDKMKPYELMYMKMRELEQLAIYNMERKYLKKQRKSFYIPFEDTNLNWFFEEEETYWFDRYWSYGLSVAEIAERMKRKPMEIFLLALSRLSEGLIKKREGGFWGGL